MKIRISFIAMIAVLGLTMGAAAGSLTPPGAVSSTMNSLADLYSSIVGIFDSSGIVVSQNGSLIQNLKYIEVNLPHPSAPSISVRESGGAFSHISSLSFEAGNFDISTIASASTVKLDWTNGPASRSAAQTITGLWTFVQAVSISQNFEVKSGYASISNTLFVSAAGNVGIGNTVPAVKLDLTGTASVSGNLSVAGYITNKGSNITSEEFGFMASATAAGSQAMGRLARATNTNALAVGFGAVASGTTGSMALGQGAKAFVAASAIAVGRAAQAKIATSIAFGATAIAGVGTSNIAIGFGAMASVTNTEIAIGSSAKAIGNGGLVIGNGTTARATDGQAIGGLASDSASGGTGLGYRSGAFANGATLGTLAYGNFGTVAIGANSTAGGSNLQVIAIGYLANSPAAFQIVTAIGYNVQPRGANSVVIGANALNNGTAGIALGNAASASGNEFVAGSTLSPMNNVYFGLGRKSTAPTTYTLNGTRGDGTNIAGAILQIAGGRGTGSGNGASISFQTAPRDGSGTTLGTLQTRMVVSSRGMVGIGTVTPRSPLFIADTGSGSLASGSFSIRSSGTLGSVASISGRSLAGGSIFNITVPASTSVNNPHGLMLVTDTNGVTIASWSMGGTLSIAGKILSDGANSSCTGVNVGGSGCNDYAESFPANDITLQAGEMVAIDPANASHVIRARYDSSIVGIVSTNPASLIDGNALRSGSDAHPSQGYVPVALAGRVPLKISQENGPIQPGDHLTLSTTPGVAMKQTQPGMSVGIALEGSGTSSTLMTFVKTSYWSPEVVAQAPAQQSAPDAGSIFQLVIQKLAEIFHVIVGDGSISVARAEFDDMKLQKGATVHDRITGELYCMTIDQGQIVPMPGACSDTVHP